MRGDSTFAGTTCARIGVHWQNGERAGDDRCSQPETQATVEKCSFAVARGLPGGPQRGFALLVSRGGRATSSDVTTFDANGRRVTPDELDAAGRPRHRLVARTAERVDRSRR